MKELEKIDNIKNIENLNLSKPYNWIYLNYDKKNGIKFFKEKDNKRIDSLSDKELKDMYRLYIFNDNFFITIYNFKDEYRYTRIDKKDIIDERIKEFYLKNNEKLKIRIGKIEGTEREVIQYIGFIGGEK
ncbi:hypothetical protein ACW0TP_08475 [Fusobacterium polymorphum]